VTGLAMVATFTILGQTSLAGIALGLKNWLSAPSLLLPVSAGTNQSSENDRSATRVTRVQPDQERSLRKTSRTAADFF
jgi:hypothetical protein